MVPDGLGLRGKVPISRLSETGEFAACRPVEVTAVNDDTTHTGSMAANPFRTGVGDDIGTESDGTLDVATHAESVVDYEGNAVVVGDFGDCWDVGHVMLGV